MAAFNIPARPDEVIAPTLVMKFGGSSVGTPGAMRQAVEIVRQSRRDWPRLVVIVSALGGVTNLLLEGALHAVDGDTQVIEQNRSRISGLHAAILDELVASPERRLAVEQAIEGYLNEFSSMCRAMAVLGEATPRALDTVAAMGERMCVRLAAAALQETGISAQAIDAVQLIETDDHFQNAHPHYANTALKTRQVLEPILEAGRVAVVTGFIGATSQGVTTTLGRGGSDFSAGILGAVLPASEVWIWTDVDGVMSADPRLVSAAITIPEITYREIAELAYYGAKVLHPKTIRPLVDCGVSLRICNTFNPEHPGTRLLADNSAAMPGAAINGNGKQNREQVIKAVTAIRGLRLITVEGRGMLGVPGVAARTFAAVASTGVSVPLITQASSEQSICFAAPAELVDRVIVALDKTFAPEIANQDIDRIWATPDVAIITVVGVGMSHTPGVAGRIFSALGAKEVNVIAIAQGSSEVSISLVVDAQETELAVRTLHGLIPNQELGRNPAKASIPATGIGVSEASNPAKEIKAPVKIPAEPTREVAR